MDDLTKSKSVSIKSEVAMASVDDEPSPFPCGYKPPAPNTQIPLSTDSPHPVLCEYCHHPADAHPPKTPESPDGKNKAASVETKVGSMGEDKIQPKEQTKDGSGTVEEPKVEYKHEYKKDSMDESKTESVKSMKTDPTSIKTDSLKSIKAEPTSIKTDSLKSIKTDSLKSIKTEPTSIKTESLKSMKTEPTPIKEIKTEPLSNTEEKPMVEATEELEEAPMVGGRLVERTVGLAVTRTEAKDETSTPAPLSSTPDNEKKEKSDRHRDKKRERHRDEKEREKRDKSGKDEAKREDGEKEGKSKDDKRKQEKENEQNTHAEDETEKKSIAEEQKEQKKSADEKTQKKQAEDASQLEQPVASVPSGDQKIVSKDTGAKIEAAEPHGIMEFAKLPDVSRKLSMGSFDDSTSSSSLDLDDEDEDDDSGVDAANLEEELGEPQRRFIVLRRVSNTFPFAKDCLNILDVTDMKEYEGKTVDPPVVMVTIEGIVPAPLDRMPQGVPQATVEPAYE